MRGFDMANGLRVNTIRYLEVNQDKLNPQLGCGSVMKQIPKFYGGDAFHKAMAKYGISHTFADQPAKLHLQTDTVVRNLYLYSRESIPLHENFYNAFRKRPVLLIVDYKKESVWFIGDTQKQLPFVNYYRDVMPHIVREWGIILSGSFQGLTPLGWQNLYDAINYRFISANPKIKTVEILSIVNDVRWRPPVLNLGINFLNISLPDVIREKINEVLQSTSQGGF